MGFLPVVSTPRCKLDLAHADSVSSALWTALFGLFGNIYIKDKPTPEQKGQIRMKNAVWVDLVNMLLWLITFAYGLVIWFRRRQTRSTYTGRAIV